MAWTRETFTGPSRSLRDMPLEEDAAEDDDDDTDEEDKTTTGSVTSVALSGIAGIVPELEAGKTEEEETITEEEDTTTTDEEEESPVDEDKAGAAGAGRGSAAEEDRREGPELLDALATEPPPASGAAALETESPSPDDEDADTVDAEDNVFSRSAQMSPPWAKADAENHNAQTTPKAIIRITPNLQNRELRLY